jgi:hypothetical protein
MNIVAEKLKMVKTLTNLYKILIIDDNKSDIL